MPASEDKDTGKLRTAMEDEAPARRTCTRAAAAPALPLDVDFSLRPEHLAI